MYFLSSGFSRPLQPSCICGMLHVQVVHSVLEINNYLIIMADEMISKYKLVLHKRMNSSPGPFFILQNQYQEHCMYLDVFQMET